MNKENLLNKFSRLVLLLTCGAILFYSILPQYLTGYLIRSSESNFEIIKRNTEELPSSALQNNFRIVIGIELLGDSDELLIILQEYARLKLNKFKGEEGA